VLETFCEVLKELLGGLFVPKETKDVPPRMKIAPFGMRDDLIHMPTQFLGFGFGGADALMLNQLLELVPKQCLSVTGGSIEFSS